MLQRLQSLWLLLATVFALLTYKFPFYNGTTLNAKNELVAAKFTASFNTFTLLLTGILIIITAASIFLFKNRKLQLRLTITALFISLINIIIYFTGIKKFQNGELSLASVFTLLLPIALFLAARGIWKDEKLVKSLDRLR